MRKLAVFGLLTLGALGVAGGVAFAAWTAQGDSATKGYGKALTMPSMAAPSVSASNSSVTVSFAAATFSTGTPVSGYAVKRYNNLNVASSISGTCTGTMIVSCADSNVANGSYTYTVAALRQNWRGIESARTAVAVAATAPVLNVTLPTSGTNYNTSSWNGGCSSAICGTASSGTGLANVKVSIRQGNGNYWSVSSFGSTSEVLNTATGTTNWSYAFPAAQFPADGTYTVRVVATDTAGNFTSISRTFVIDRSGPSTGQFGFGFIKNGQVLSVASVSDATSGVASVAYRLCSDLSCTSSTPIGSSSTSPYSYPWILQPADGPIFIGFVATDNAGNTTSGAATATIDNTAPTTTDNATSAWTKTAQTVTFTRTDGTGSGVTNTYFTTDGSTPTTSSSLGTSVTLGVQGTYTIKYFSVDAVGNIEPVKTASNQVRIDTTAPTAAGLTSPTAGAFIKNGVQLTASGTDALSGVTSASYFYCAGTICTPTTLIGSSTATSTFPFTWNSQPANGPYQLLARVSDAAGNTFDSPKVSVTVDNIAPTGSITSPAANATVSGSSVALTASASDLLSGVASVQFQYSPASAGTWTNIGSADTVSPYTGTWNSTLVADGSYDLRTLTTDKAGNTFNSTVVTVITDNTFTPVSVQLVNGGGNAAGKVEAGDSIVVTYSDPLHVSDMCSTWSGDTANQSISGNNDVTVQLNDGGTSQDTITVSVAKSACSTFNFGTINLGDTGYVSGGNATFPGPGNGNNSTISWNAAAKTLTITLGSKGGSGSIPSTPVPTSVAAYIPSSSLRSSSLISITGTASTGSAQQF